MTKVERRGVSTLIRRLDLTMLELLTIMNLYRK